MGPGVTLKITGLIPDHFYKVAVYSDRFGTGGAGTTDNYTVRDIVKTLQNPGVLPATPLPGTENIDYALFIVKSTSAGEIIASGAYITGVQIEGLLDPAEKGPQIDCRIKKSGKGLGGKGNGIYSTKITPSQSLTQRTIGRRAKRYYLNIENDGNEIDRCHTRAYLRKREVTIKAIDRDGGGNVTSDVVSTPLEAEKNIGFSLR